MDANITTVEADAVHHRLDSRVNSVRGFPFSCYDCNQGFSTLEDVAQHSLANPMHGEEKCLKCKNSIIVFLESDKPVRIHSCKKSDLCHLHPDLYLHSQYLFSKFEASGLTSEHTIFGCDLLSCEASFEPTVNGIFQFLKHVNKYKHTSLPNCRRCSLPEFRLTLGNVQTNSHFCIKTGKVVFISKSLVNC